MAPEACEGCPQWEELKQQRIRLARLLKRASDGLEQRIGDKDFKLTLADYLKLLQMEKEIEDEAPKEIKVTWVEPLPTSKPEQ